MFRNALNDLINWKNKPAHKPLMVRGARQVGKSYLVREFGKTHFQNFIEINFEERPEFKEVFVANPVEKIIPLLETFFQTKINSQTLIFLDEIQAAPEVIPKLRYFYEKLPELFVIAAGSLLEFILSDHQFSMPVGRIEYLYLGPMSFAEFLHASNETELENYLTKFTLQEHLPLLFHQKLMQLLTIYMFLGGMPEVVQNYISSHSLLESDAIKKNLLSTYHDDFGKYDKKIYFTRIKNIFYKIPLMVGDKVKYVNLDPHERAKDVALALTLLAMARVCYRIYHSSANGVPLQSEMKTKNFKMLFLDVGLMASVCGITALDLQNNLQFVNQGKLCEQFVGQHLLYDHPYFQEPELFYWMREERNAAAEVDFLLTQNQRIIPVEVKSGTTGRMKSLQVFLKEKKQNVAVRFNTDLPSVLKTRTNLPHDNIDYKLISLPFYLIGQVRRLVGGEL